MTGTAILSGGPHNGLRIPMDTHLRGWVYVGVHGYRRIPFNGTTLHSRSEVTYEHVYSPRPAWRSWARSGDT